MTRCLAFASLLLAAALLPSALRAGEAAPPPAMSWLDNGTIRLGVDLNLGGAITWLSSSGSQANLVNSADWGREIQMSFYAGPIPYVVGDKKPAESWKGLGWNPIQSGDYFRNRSKIIEHRNDGTTITLSCVPMHWPLDNVPGECVFTSRITLAGATAEITAGLRNQRQDPVQYDGRSQELPAVYSVGTCFRLISYTGAAPFTGGELNTIVKSAAEQKRTNFPWAHFQATENWAALVDAKGWGLGVWNPGTYAFLGGFNGEPGRGGPKDGDCGYIAPVQNEILDHDIEYSYHYVLVLGTVQEIRDHVYAHAQRPAPPDYRFERDRQHWHYHDAVDAGWPISGGLRVKLDGKHPQLIGPPGFWLAEHAPVLSIVAAITTSETQARLLWTTLDAGFAAERSVAVPIQGDGVERRYRVDLSAAGNWHGPITGLRFDPLLAGHAGDTITVKAITFSGDGPAK